MTQLKILSDYDTKVLIKKIDEALSKILNCSNCKIRIERKVTVLEHFFGYPIEINIKTYYKRK